MELHCDQLVLDFEEAIQGGSAALFIGAGMSRASGFVDWRGLLKGCAEEVGLDLDREYDLVAVAQYYLNLGAGNRHRLNNVLLKEFGQRGQISENHRIIANLPIHTLWTTNFDRVIEEAFEAAHRRLEVKTRVTDIPLHRQRRRDAVLFKMHGDIAQPDEVVICKADYERYARDHKLFQTTLEADLASKTFLFLGFSFADPNLNYMLGHLQSMLESNAKVHFALMRRVRANHTLPEPERSRAFDYERNKQELQVRELERYHVRTLLIDQFSDVTDVLRAIDVAAVRRNVFVSGSIHAYGAEGLPEPRMRDLCMQLGEELMARELRLVTGFGLNVGQVVFQGALLKLYETKDIGVEDHFILRPFPREQPMKGSQEEFNRRYRDSIVRQCGFAVFIAGTSKSHSISHGVMEEYRIARQLSKVLIPLGVTGFAARKIWHEVAEDLDAVYHGAVDAELFAVLNDDRRSNTEILNAVFCIIDRVNAAGTRGAAARVLQ